METGFGVATGLGSEYAMLGPQLNMLKAAIEGIDIPGFERYGPHPILARLYNNDEFASSLIEWFADRLNHEFNPDSMNYIVEEMAAEIRPYMKEYKQRWPFIGDVNDEWENSLEQIKEFNKRRPEYMRRHLREQFDAEITEIITPMDYKLYQNFPNPFNASTTIKYQIPKATNVTLNIFNSRGQKVDSFTKRHNSSGHYSIVLNSLKYSTGLFLYTINVDDFRDAKKMILLK